MLGNLAKRKSANPLSLPGIITGYGGGTFNPDGTMATPAVPLDQQSNAVAMPVNSVPAPKLGMFGSRGRYTFPDDISNQARWEETPLVANPVDEPPQMFGQQFLQQPMDVHVPKPGFFAKDGAWKGVLADVLGTLGDSIATANGGQATYLPNKLRVQQQQAEWKHRQAEREQDRAWQVDDRDHKDNLPQYFMSGKDRIAFDPKTGETQTVFDAPTDFQEYADLLGLVPGSDEYNSAMEDYVLRSNGPTAQLGRANLEDIRQGNRLKLRQTPTYANLHPRPTSGGNGGGGSGGGNHPPRTPGNVYAPILDKIARGIPLTPGEQNVINMRGRGGHGSSGRSTTGTHTATDPKTGKKVQWNGSQWVPVN